MPEIKDTKRVFSTIYTEINFSTEREVQKTEVIPAEPGMCIKIERLSMRFQVSAPGAVGTAIVTAETGGEVKELATFTTAETAYQDLTQEVNYIAGEGLPVTLRWRLKTTDPANRSRMRDLAYVFNYADPEPVEEPGEPEPLPEPQAYIMIPCTSESEAGSVMEKIKPVVEDLEVFVKIA